MSSEDKDILPAQHVVMPIVQEATYCVDVIDIRAEVERDGIVLYGHAQLPDGIHLVQRRSDRWYVIDTI